MPSAASPTDAPTKAQMDAAAGGWVQVADLLDPHTGVWPAVDATNGPLKVNSAITNVAPSFTGLTYHPWNSTPNKFCKQSQNWVSAPAVTGLTAGDTCVNVTTNRTTNYYGTGVGAPGPIDTWFSADTTKIIVKYWVTTTYANNLGISTPNHEVLLFAEHEGQMKSIEGKPGTPEPAVWAHAQGGGNQYFYKSWEFSRSNRKKFRLMLSAGCQFAGIYVDTGAKVLPGQNKPVLISGDTDSWAEPVSNVWSSVGGNGGSAGITWPSGCSLLLSNAIVQLAIHTGFATMPNGHGGTGYSNPGPGTGNTEDFSGVGSCPFMATNRVNFWSDTYGPTSPKNRYSIVFVAGGYNDGGTLSTATQKALALKGFDKYIAKVSGSPTVANGGLPIIVRGIQVKTITQGATYDLSNTGIKQACTDRSGNVIGFIDDMYDYNYVDIKASNLGPDGLHPTVEGGNQIGKRDAEKIALMWLPRSYINNTLAAIVA